MKINLGCGTNWLKGWQNYDADVDITGKLPWEDGVADFVFAEHVVEHVAYTEALAFFAECLRVLKRGGIARIAVPSVEQVWQLATEEYCQFASKWVPEAGKGITPDDRRRGAMANILFKHGHQAPWTKGLLQASLFYVGFSKVWSTYAGYSNTPALRDIEGHGRVIGEEFNAIETVVVEATK